MQLKYATTKQSSPLSENFSQLLRKNLVINIGRTTLPPASLRSYGFPHLLRKTAWLSPLVHHYFNTLFQLSTNGSVMK